MATLAQRTQFLNGLGRLLTYAEGQGIKVICFTFYRSPEDQAKEVAKGTSTLLHGRHQEWMAVDLCIVGGRKLVWRDAPEYTRLGEFWEQVVGGVWGGRWKDPHDIYHFEM